MISEQIPPVRIAESDLHLLKQIAAEALEARHPVSHFLVAELERAEISSSAAAAGSVHLDGWVTFRADADMPSESRRLVLPEKFRDTRLHVSVLSPLGAALIGLPVGARMPYAGIDGTRRIVTVENLDPPEGVISLQHRRAMKGLAPPDGNNPDRPGPTAA
ncbi:MAG: GreA/GreB family elongation factor [Xanthobacteraceae bacterium]